MTSTAAAYLDRALNHLERLRPDALPAIDAAATAIVESARAGGRVLVFGTGHSHLFAEELHYRAGGLAIVVPVLAGPTMLHEGARAGTAYERMAGIVTPILERYAIDERDVLVVASNSGVNAAPLEAADFGRARGARVIALTSVPYSEHIAHGRPTLASRADIVLDNATPPGDAAVEIPGSAIKAGPLSTLVGVALMNALVVEVAARLAADGDAPIYLSANMPGAEDVNRALVERYRARNPHL